MPTEKVSLIELLTFLQNPRTAVEIKRQFGLLTPPLQRLKRLYLKGWVAPIGETKTPFKGYYWQITEKGRKLLEAL